MTIETRQMDETMLRQAKETIERLKKQGFTDERLKTYLFEEHEYEIRYQHPSKVPQERKNDVTDY